MKRKLRRTSYFALMAMLLLNLALPASFISANDESQASGSPAVGSVTDHVYGTPSLVSPMSATEITYDLIQGVEMWNDLPFKEDGSPNPEAQKIRDIRPGSGDTVVIDYSWELPDEHHYSDGATFTFKLPDKFSGFDETGELYAEVGVVGTFTISSNGQVVFTFNEQINSGQGYTGNFYIWRQFDGSALEDSTKQNIVFDIPHRDSVTIPVHFKPDGNATVTKKGEAYKNGSPNSRNPDEIHWVVDFNLGEETISNAVFRDKLPNGLTVNLDSVEVTELQVKIKGGEPGQGASYTNFTKDNTNDGFKIEFNGIIDKAYRVEYTTKVPLPSGGDADYSPRYKNDVEVSGTVDSKPFSQKAGVSVPVKFNEPLNKKASNYNPSKQEIEWTIDYNFNQQALAEEEALLVDTFDTTQQELVPGSFKVYSVTIDNSGNATNSNLVDSTNYIFEGVGTGFDKGFKLKFKNGVNSAYQIKYTTKAINRVYESQEVTNTVEMFGGIKKSDTQKIGQEVFKKHNGTINYADKTITWTIDLNKDKHEMTGVVISDDFASQGLELISLTISNLTEDEDYTLTIEADSGENEGFDKGFNIEFKNTITEHHTITYKTSFDPTYFTPDKVKTHTYENQAEIKWNEYPNPPDTLKYQNKTAVTEPYMKNNGHKEGKYDAVNKVITWTIDVNFNRHVIDQAVVRDFYTKGQDFVEGSLKVHPLTIAADGKVSVPEGTPEFKAYEFNDAVEHDGKKGFELTFNDQINSAYRITYQTSLKGYPVLKEGYSNQATLHDGNDPSKTLLFNKGDQVGPPKAGEYVAKKLPVQGTGSEQVYATWTVNVNFSQSYVAKPSLTDTLSPNQILQQDSFQLYKPEVTTSGVIDSLRNAKLVDPSEYTITFETNEETGADSFTLTFHKPIEEAYILQYKSFINDDSGQTISNGVTFAGHSDSAGIVEGNKDSKVSFTPGAGGRTFMIGTGYIKVVKVDADEPNTKLAGAIFELQDESGTNVLETLTTDSNGEVTTKKKYKYRKYVLKEVEAPSGYLIDEEYKDGKTIEFTSDKTGDTVPFTITNEKGVWDVELKKYDKNDPTKALAGAIFKLQKKNPAGQYVDVDGATELKTDMEGKIFLANLDAGDYQFVETKAPLGYKLDDTPITFQIDPRQTAMVTRSMANEIIRNASVELTKTDEYDGTPLEGAEFELRDADGNVVVISGEPQSGLKTGADGKLTVNGLVGGSYQFVETKAPEHYILDPTPIEFDIEEEGKIVSVSSVNRLIPGSVKLTKVESGRPNVKLKGAQFTLLDERKNPVIDAEGNELKGLTTDGNGELLITELIPGKYYFEETKAPAGYYIKTRLTEFEIVRSQEDEAVVIVENYRYTDNGGGGGGGGYDPGPSTPTDPKPGNPKDPETPVDPNPETPGKPNPEKPNKPATPGEKVKTPKETPVQGDANVPEGSEAKIGKEPEHGKVTIDPNGKWTYTPNPGYVGEDSFTVVVTDAAGNEETVHYDVLVEKLPAGGNGEVSAGNGPHPGPGSGSGQTLPKTGEDSHLMMQLTGLGLVALGIVFLRRKRSRNA